MMQLISTADANKAEYMEERRLEMGSGTQMPVSARMGPGPNTGGEGYTTIPLTMVAVDPAGTSQRRPHMRITGNMEGPEHNPIIARSIVAANVKYDNCTSESNLGTIMRKESWRAEIQDSM